MITIDFYAEAKKPRFTFKVTEPDGASYLALMTPTEVSWNLQCNAGSAFSNSYQLVKQKAKQ